MNKKIRFVFIPFLIISCCFIGVYTFLNWILHSTPVVFSIWQGLPDVVLPLVLPVILVFILLRPRFKCLVFTGRSKNPQGFIFCMAAFAIGIPAMFAQDYMKSATGQLTRLDDISQINSHNKTKYYAVGKHVVDKKHAGIYAHAYGRGNKKYVYTIDMAVIYSVLKEQADTTADYSNWIIHNYKDEIKHKLSDEEEKLEAKAFRIKSMADFDTTNLENFVYLERIEKGEELDNYVREIKKTGKYDENNKDNTIFYAFTEPFENRSGIMPVLFLGSWGAGILLCFVILVPGSRLNQEEFDKFNKRKNPDKSFI